MRGPDSDRFDLDRVARPRETGPVVASLTFAAPPSLTCGIDAVTDFARPGPVLSFNETPTVGCLCSPGTAACIADKYNILSFFYDVKRDKSKSDGRAIPIHFFLGLSSSYQPRLRASFTGCVQRRYSSKKEET